MTLAEHLNPFHVRRVTITTPLSAATCVERLRADIAPWYVFWGVKYHLRGSVRETKFAVRRFTGARRSLPSEARGTLEPDGRGMCLQFVIGWRIVDIVGLAIAMAMAVWVGTMAAAQDRSVEWMTWVLVPVILLAVLLHRVMTFHEDDWLVERLCTLLGGSEVPQGT